MEEMLGENPLMIFAGYPVQNKLDIPLPRLYLCRAGKVFMLKVASHGFETEVSMAELSNVLAKKITDDFRKDWNAEVCERLFEMIRKILVKDYLLILCP